MESRKMVLMNLFSGKEWRRRLDLWTQWGKERGDKGRKPHQDIYAPGLRGAAGEKLRAAQEPRL